jgi:hypothetical protein
VQRSQIKYADVPGTLFSLNFPCPGFFPQPLRCG